jgi:hypothetical protein
LRIAEPLSAATSASIRAELGEETSNDAEDRCALARFLRPPTSTFAGLSL